jgi:hypothetical protein
LVSPDDGASDAKARLPYPQDAIARKLRHDEVLRRRGIPVYDGLPPVVGECELLLRSTEDVARRALALFAIALRAESLALKEEMSIADLRERLSVGFEFSPLEAEFMETAQPEQQAIINEQARLRAPGEILDEVDMHFRLHWAARQAHQQGLPAPANVDIGVIQERRLALNWLTHFENAEWDDVDCPT